MVLFTKTRYIVSHCIIWGYVMNQLNSNALVYIFNEYQLESLLSSHSTSVTHIYCTLKYEDLKPALVNKLKRSTLTSISFSDAHTLYPNEVG